MKYIKFYILISVIIASLFVLPSCGDDAVDGTDTDTGSNIQPETEDTGTSSGGSSDPILNAGELDKKFKAMSRTDNNMQSITVITEEFLNKMWIEDFSSDRKYSLSTEEINYIIADSVRIYREYRYIVLEPVLYGTVYSDYEHSSQYPMLFNETIDKSQSTGHHDDCTNIYKIINYRIRALSSPDAFVTVYDYDSTDLHPHFSSIIYLTPASAYYIPDYSDKVQSDKLKEYLKDDSDAESAPLDYFCVSPYGTSIVEYYPKGGDGTKLFPSEELTGSKVTFISEGTLLMLDTFSMKFNLSLMILSSVLDYGSYTYDQESGVLILYGNGTRYVFTQTEDKDAYQFMSYASLPNDGTGLIKPDAVFYPQEEDITDSLKISRKHNGSYSHVEPCAIPGHYTLTSDEQSKIEWLVASYTDWKHEYVDHSCKQKWTFTYTAYDLAVMICDCGRISENYRSRILTDHEWNQIMQILKKHSPDEYIYDDVISDGVFYR